MIISNNRFKPIKHLLKTPPFQKSSGAAVLYLVFEKLLYFKIYFVQVRFQMAVRSLLPASLDEGQSLTISITKSPLTLNA